MERNERIYIPKVRGPLPRKYRLGLDRPNYNWRAVSYLLIGCTIITGIVWLVMK